MMVLAHQTRFLGGVFKLPKGALVKSQGIERLGKGVTRITSSVDKGDERE